MALVHDFAVIPKDSSEYSLSSAMEQIKVPDDLILYIFDTLKWIYFNWHGDRLETGLAYYGLTIIEGNQINRLMETVMAWKNLFELAPETIILTGNFMPDEDKYEKIKYSKKKLMEIFNSWICLCKKAIANDAKILHIGI